MLDGIANGPSSANHSTSTGSYVPPQPQNGSGTGNQSNPLIPEIKIREWVWTAANPYRHPEIVVAVPVGWPVPTVHRLWFGTSMGKNCRNNLNITTIPILQETISLEYNNDDHIFNPRTIMLAMISLSDKQIRLLHKFSLKFRSITYFFYFLDDKKRRLRAFLSCLHADTALMLNPDYVPQHLLILACVLRYIMAASQGTILQKQELDALIVQAFAMEITNPNYLQDLQVVYREKMFLYFFL